MLLDKLLQNKPVNEISISADRDRNAVQNRRKENDGANKTSFSDVLKGVSEKEKHEEKPREVSVQDLKDKIRDIEKKVDKMSENATGQKKAELEEVKKTLEKVKQLLETMNGSDKGVQIDFGKVSIDFRLFLNNILSGIQELLGKSNVKELQNLINFLNKKLDEASALLNPGKTEGTGLQGVNGNEAETADASFDRSPGKVKIVDLRENRAETPANLTAMKKGAMTAEKTFGFAEQKTAKADKAYEMILTKGMEKEIQEALKEKGVNPAAFMKNVERDTGALQVKNAPVAGSVSRAAMEALFQNVAGRLSVTLRDGKSEFRMNLTPPELGHMRMKFTLQDGQLMGKIVVSTPEAKALFDQNLGELQRQLQQAGITMGNMDVSYSQDGNSAQNDPRESRNTVGSLFLNDDGNAAAEESVASYRNDIYGSKINFLA